MMDYLFLAVDALLLFRSGRAVLRNRLVEIPADLPGQLAANILLIALFGVAVFLRREVLTFPLLILGGGALYVLLSFFSKAGLGEAGLIYNGKVIPYDTIDGFLFERENEAHVFVRLRTQRREYALRFAAADKEEIQSRLLSHVIRDLSQRANPYSFDEDGNPDESAPENDK